MQKKTDKIISKLDHDDAGDLEPIREIDRSPDRLAIAEKTNSDQQAAIQSTVVTYLILPTLFLAVTFFGGMRLAAADNAFIFLKPALICLVFAALTLILFARSGMIALDRWFSNDNSGLRNAANAAILLTLAAATTQLYNSLLPESGIPFWIFGFCFFWTLWTNLFAELDARRLVRSLISMYGLAFAMKYLVLANLIPTASGNWLQRLIENPGKETFAWLLDLPRYSDGTGYVQFFTLVLYILGLYLIPRKSSTN